MMQASELADPTVQDEEGEKTNIITVSVVCNDIYMERSHDVLSSQSVFGKAVKVQTEVVEENVWVIKVNGKVIYSLTRGDGWPASDFVSEYVNKQHREFPHMQGMHEVLESTQRKLPEDSQQNVDPMAVCVPNVFARAADCKSPTFEQVLAQQKGLVTIDGEDFYDIPLHSEVHDDTVTSPDIILPQEFLAPLPSNMYEHILHEVASVKSVSLDTDDAYQQYIHDEEHERAQDAYLREYHSNTQLNETNKKNALVFEPGLQGNIGSFNVNLTQEFLDIRAEPHSVVNEAILDTADVYPHSNQEAVAKNSTRALVIKKKVKSVVSKRSAGAQQEEFAAIQLLRPLVESPCIHCFVMVVFFLLVITAAFVLMYSFPKFIQFYLSELPMQIEKTNDFVRGWNLGQSLNDGFVKTVGYSDDDGIYRSNVKEVQSVYESVIPEKFRSSVYHSLKNGTFKASKYNETNDIKPLKNTQTYKTMSEESMLIGTVDRVTGSSSSGGYFRALGRDAARKFSNVRLDHLSDVILTRSLASKEIVVQYEPHHGDAMNMETLQMMYSYESEMRNDNDFQKHCLLDWSAVKDGGVVQTLNNTELLDVDSGPIRGALMNQRVAAEAAAQVQFDHTNEEAHYILQQAYTNLKEYNSKFQQGLYPHVTCVWPTSILRPSETVATQSIISNSTHTCASQVCKPLGQLTKGGHLSENIKNERLKIYSAQRIPEVDEVLSPEQQVLSTFVPEWFDIVDSSFGSGRVRSNALRSKFHFGLPLQGYMNVATSGEEQVQYLDSYVATMFIPDLQKWANRVQAHMIMTFESVDSGVLGDLFNSEIAKSRILIVASVALAGIAISIVQRSCCIAVVTVFLGFAALCVTFFLYRLLGYSYIGLYHQLTALVVMFICVDYVLYYYTEWDQAERLHAPISILSKSGRIKDSSTDTQAAALENDEDEDDHEKGGIFRNLQLLQEDVMKQYRQSSWNSDEGRYMIYWTLRRLSFTLRSVMCTTQPALLCLSIAISQSGIFSMPAQRSFAVFTVMAPLGILLVFTCGLPSLTVCHRKHQRHRRCCFIAVKDNASMDQFLMQASAAGRLTRSERFFHHSATRFVIKYKFLCLFLSVISIALVVYVIITDLTIDRSDMSSAMFVSDHPINKYNDVREHFRQGDTISVNFVFGLDSKHPIDRSEVDPQDRNEIGKALFTNVYVNKEGSFDVYRSRFCILSLCDYLSSPNDYQRVESKTVFNEPKCVLSEMSRWLESADLSRFSGISNVPNGLYNNTLTEEDFWIAFYVFMAFEREYCVKNGASFSCAEKYNKNVVFNVNTDVSADNQRQLQSVQVKLLVIEAKLSQNRNIEYEEGIAFFNVWEEQTNFLLGANSPAKGCRSHVNALPRRDATLAQQKEYAPWYNFDHAISPAPIIAPDTSPMQTIGTENHQYRRQHKPLKFNGQKMRAMRTYHGNEYPAQEQPLGSLSGFQCGGDSTWQPWHIYFFQKLFGEEATISILLGTVCVFVWLLLITGTPVLAFLGLVVISISEAFMVGLVPIFGYSLGIVTVAPILLYPGYCSIQIYRLLETYSNAKAINPKEKVREALTKNATSIVVSNVIVIMCSLLVAISETAAFRNFALLFIVSSIHQLFVTLCLLPSLLLLLGPGGQNGNVYLRILHAQCCWRLLDRHESWRKEKRKRGEMMLKGKEQEEEIISAQRLATDTVKDVLHDEDVEVKQVLQELHNNIELRVLCDMDKVEQYSRYTEERNKESCCYPTSCNDRLRSCISFLFCFRLCRKRQKATMWDMINIKTWQKKKHNMSNVSIREETHLQFNRELDDALDVLEQETSDDDSDVDEDSLTVDEFIAEKEEEQTGDEIEMTDLVKS